MIGVLQSLDELRPESLLLDPLSELLLESLDDEPLSQDAEAPPPSDSPPPPPCHGSGVGSGAGRSAACALLPLEPIMYPIAPASRGLKPLSWWW